MRHSGWALSGIVVLFFGSMGGWAAETRLTESDGVGSLPGQHTITTDTQGHVISAQFSPFPAWPSSPAQDVASSGAMPARGLPPPVQVGWPVQFSSWSPSSELAVGDVDGNGDLDVVVHVTLSLAGDGVLRIYDSHGNLLPGSPIPVTGNAGGSEHPSHPILGDIDGDGDLEIFVGRYGFHHDGTLVSGWPQLADPGCTYFPRQVTTIADLNGDHQVEVIGIKNQGAVFSGDPCSTGSKIYIWDAQGHLRTQIVLPPHPPLGLTPHISPPAVGDLDGDGDLEIVVTGSQDGAWGIYAFHHTGGAVTGWPQLIPYFGSQALFSFPHPW